MFQVTLGPRMQKESKGGPEREEASGRDASPQGPRASGGSRSSAFWNVTRACQGVLERLLPKPLTPHPGQSHAGSSSRAILTVHWCPAVDRKQALISLPPEASCPADGEGTAYRSCPCRGPAQGMAPALSPP